MTQHMVKIRLEPVVVFGVLEHHTRRNEAQSRVVGILLGSFVDGYLEVRNLVPIPHQESSDGIQLDVRHRKSAIELHKQVNRHDTEIGWYSTGISDSTVPFHEWLTRNCHINPLHLLVEPSLDRAQLEVKCLFNIASPNSVSVGDHKVNCFLKEVPFEYKTHNAERLAIQMMVDKSYPQLSAGCASSKLYSSGVPEQNSRHKMLAGQVQHQLGQLQGNLHRISQYVSMVVNGEAKEDKEVGRQLMKIVTSLPVLKHDEYETLFNNGVAEGVVLMMLSKLIRLQLILSEKVYEKTIQDQHHLSH
jgi:hypothetical protein